MSISVFHCVLSRTLPSFSPLPSSYAISSDLALCFLTFGGNPSFLIDPGPSYPSERLYAWTGLQPHYFISFTPKLFRSGLGLQALDFTLREGIQVFCSGLGYLEVGSALWVWFGCSGGLRSSDLQSSALPLGTG